MEEFTSKIEIESNDNEVLSMYLKEINRIPLITHEEEYELAIKAKHGDMKAREKLLTSNLRFVVNVAKKYRGQGLPLSDLINEGNLGLIVALDKFEPDMGYHFISYAVWWIKQSIMKAISDKGRPVRIPLNRASDLMKIQRCEKDLMNKNETSDISVNEIAEITGLDPRLITDLKAISGDMISFDSPVKKGEDSDSTFGDFLEDSSYGPDNEVMMKQLKTDVISLLDILSEKERKIIELRYGIGGNKPMSLKEIGDSYALTKERIRQIEKRALQKLQKEGLEREMDSYSRAV